MTDHKPIPWLVPDMRFVSLQVPKKEPSAKLQGYRVYRTKDDFVEVEAATIPEAMEKTGVQSPWKIERLGLKDVSIYQQGTLARISGYGGEQKMEDAMRQTAAKATQAQEADQKPEEKSA